jgi:hypothetical protein
MEAQLQLLEPTKEVDIQSSFEISGLTKTMEMFLRGLKVLHLNNEQGLC